MADLFNKKVINTYLQNHSIPEIEEKIGVIKNWQSNLETIKRHNEKELQAAFLKGILGRVLGYKGIAEGEEWNLAIEASTEIDASKPDGILGFYSGDEEITQAVIELKGPEISLDKKQKRAGKDYGTPVEQAFGYASKYDRCQWVIVSNMIEIRLYKVLRSQEYYESFHLSELAGEDEFKKFHLLLCRQNLIDKSGTSATLELSQKTEEHTEDISVEFYNLFKEVRVQLFEHLKENNTEVEEEVLLEKAQKFLDRIIFICFCEDIGLLPANLLAQALTVAQSSFSLSEATIWQEIKGIFRSIDQGNPKHNINAYNGGLFARDEAMDKLVIKNDFFEVVAEIAAYDFDSELDVNILGHIFEQSIADIEALKADIRNNEYEQTKSRRKKDGIFYTPEQITGYIVENTVGRYLADMRKELGEEELPEISSATTPQVKGRYVKKHLQFYQQYEEKLKEIKILDPACGSGAFLNQAFDYLFREHRWIRKQISRLEEGQTSIFGLGSLQKEILQDNLYGVDLNQESVEITKLSLWLKTASKEQPLADLDQNIKCGNSLIDDRKLAGTKAFNWEKEFADIIEKGGFDVVIGNPPYVRQEELKEIKPYLKDNYQVYQGMADLYCYFFEKGIKLLKDDGYFSFIVSNKFTRTDYGRNLREFLLDFQIIEYTDYTGKNVFADAEVEPCIIIIKKSTPAAEHLITYDQNQTMPQNYLTEDSWAFTGLEEYEIMEKIEERGIPLKEWNIEINYGIKTGCNDAFIIDMETWNKLTFRQVLKPLLRGRDIKRYKTKEHDEWLINIEAGWTDENRGDREPESFFADEYPFIYKWLKNVGEKIENGDIYARGKGLFDRDDQGDYWWELRPCSYLEEFEKNKVVWPMVSTRECNFTFAEKGIYLNNKCYMITGKSYEFLKYILAILNSSLAWFYFANRESELGEDSLEIRKEGVLNFPVPEIEQKEQRSLGNKADSMVKLNRQLSRLKAESFLELVARYSSQTGLSLSDIIDGSDFYNQIYSGRARKVRDLTVNINNTILTLYSDKSGNGKYELFKFEVENENKRQYLKLYLENLTEGILEEINNYQGGLIKKLLQIKVPDYNKPAVINRILSEWQENQENIEYYETNKAKLDREIDERVFELYGLTEEEIRIVKESI